MRRQVAEEIGAIARRQYGVVTRRQLLDAGLSSAAVDREAARGWIHRLHRGVYRVGPVLPPRGREMAAVLACGAGAVVSHRSAAALRGWVPRPRDRAPVEVVLPDARHHRSRPGIRVRRVGTLASDERDEIDGVPVTAPGRTLLDLAGVAAAREVERAVARAERERLLRRRDLEALLTRYAGRPGLPLLRAVITAAGGPAFTRSEAEAVFLDLVREARLPPPEVNVIVAGYEIDFFWRDASLAVEVDGYRHHSNTPAFEGDRRRTTHLGAEGIQVIRLSWRQITEERFPTGVKIGQALLLGRRR